jgi:hypothetical protein
MGRVVIATARPLYSREKDPIPLLQEAGWASGPVWTSAEYLALIGIRFPDLTARSESLYRLCPFCNFHETHLAHLSLDLFSRAHLTQDTSSCAELLFVCTLLAGGSKKPGGLFNNIYIRIYCNDHVDCRGIRKVSAALTLTQCVMLHQRLGFWGTVAGGGKAVFISDFVSNILCLNSYIALF